MTAKQPSSAQLSRLRARLRPEAATQMLSKASCPLPLTEEFLEWLSSRTHTLTYSPGTTITPEHIAFVSGQEELINILIAEYQKQQEGMIRG